MDRYLDKRLCKEEEEEFIGHIHACDSCRNEYVSYKGLYTAMELETVEKAPGGFTEFVMDKILTLEPHCPADSNRRQNTNYTPIFRRLGVSMIVTAAVMLLYINIPVNPMYTAYKVNPVQKEENKWNITVQLENLNMHIMNTFTKINSSIEKFKEV